MALARRSTAKFKRDRLDVMMFGAVKDGVTDCAAPLQEALDLLKSDGGGRLFIPAGSYAFSTGLDITDCTNIEIYGAGPQTVLIPLTGYPSTTNFIDFSGSTDMILRNLRISGANISLPSVTLSALYGDGTTTHTTYGRVTISDLILEDWEQQGFGIGATIGHTAEDIKILNCRFIGCGAGAEGSHPIDCGSSGTKRRYTIRGNVINFTSQPTIPAGGGNGIFVGHGLNYDFIIQENQVIDAPAAGIIIYNRPISAETCVFKNVVLANNNILRSRGPGLRVLGGNGISVLGNTIMNPGYGATSSGIQVANGVTGASTYTKVEDVVITGNSIVDTQGTHTMSYGIHIATDDPSGAPSGVLSSNTISGYLTKDVFFDNFTSHVDWGETRSKPGRVAHGDAYGFTNDHAEFSVLGDIRAEAPSGSNEPLDLHTTLIVAPEVAAGNYRMGVGFNARFDRATSKYYSGTDGTNNGLAAILCTQADGSLGIFCIDSTGATAQNMTVAQLEAGKQMGVEPGQVRLLPANTEVLRAKPAGVAMGAFDPTAALHLPAGTATAGTAPIKITSGTLLASVEDGVFEYDGTDIYFSISSTRYKLMRVTSSDLTYLGNIGALQPAGGNTVGAWLVSRSWESDADWMIGIGLNIQWDGSNWQIPGAGSNGAFLITTSTSDGTGKIYSIASIGTGARSLTHVQLQTYLVATIGTDGKLTMKAGLQGTELTLTNGTDTTYYTKTGISGAGTFTISTTTKASIPKLDAGTTPGNLVRAAAVTGILSGTSVDLVNDVSGTLGTGHGGTGVTTLADLKTGLAITIADVSGLQTALDNINTSLGNKSDIGHTHSVSVSGTTDSGGSPAHTHGATLSGTAT